MMAGTKTLILLLIQLTIVATIGAIQGATRQNYVAIAWAVATITINIDLKIS